MILCSNEVGGLSPFGTFQPLLAMHQLGYLSSKPFVCCSLAWILQLLFHHLLHLSQWQESEQLQVPEVQTLQINALNELTQIIPNNTAFSLK